MALIGSIGRKRYGEWFDAGCAGRLAQIVDITTLQLGPGAILVPLTVSFKQPADAVTIRDTINSITQTLRQVDDRVAHVYVRPSPLARPNS